MLVSIVSNRSRGNTYNAEDNIEAQATSDGHCHHLRDGDEDASFSQLFASQNHIILDAPECAAITVRKPPTQISRFHAAGEIIEGLFNPDGLGRVAVETSGKEKSELSWEFEVKMEEEEIQRNRGQVEEPTLENCIVEWPRFWHKADGFCDRRRFRGTSRRERKALCRQSNAAKGPP